MRQPPISRRPDRFAIRRPDRPASPVLALLALAALGCGGGTGTEPEPSAPVITVAGVEDGAVADGPVTITIAVDVGTWVATLNGRTFFSGTTVEGPGSYVLRVDASHAGKTSSVELRFEILVAGDSVLLIRLLDLGDNDAGGGGDAIVLTDSTGAGQRHIVIDAGPSGAEGADRDFVLQRLRALGVDTLEALILTHAHSDHFDGMADILRGLHVRAFYHNGQERSFFRYEEVLALARSRAEAVVVPGQVVDVELRPAGTTTLRVVPPLPTYLTDPSAGSSELNDGSLGVALVRGTFTMFFAGDGEVEANQRWRTSFATLTRDLVALKVGHHGANDAVFDNGALGGSAWLEHTDPELRIISANGTTHPRIRALDLLQGRTGTRTYCTNVHGDITVRVDTVGAYTVRVERNAGAGCAPGDLATT